MTCRSVFQTEGGQLLHCFLEEGHGGEWHCFSAKWTDDQAYAPLEPLTIDEQFMLLKSKFPDATPYGIAGSGSDACFTSYQNLQGEYHLPKYGGFLVRFTLDLPKGKFNMDRVWVAFEVPPGFPATAPKDVYTDEKLRMAYGGYGWRGGEAKPRLLDWQRCQWIMTRVQAWNPNHCSLYTYAMVIKQGFETFQERPLYDDEFSS